MNEVSQCFDLRNEKSLMTNDVKNYLSSTGKKTIIKYDNDCSLVSRKDFLVSNSYLPRHSSPLKDTSNNM